MLKVRYFNNTLQLIELIVRFFTLLAVYYTCVRIKNDSFAMRQLTDRFLIFTQTESGKGLYKRILYVEPIMDL